CSPGSVLWSCGLCPPVSAQRKSGAFYLSLQDHYSGNRIYSHSYGDRLPDLLLCEPPFYDACQKRKGIYLGTKIKKLIKKIQLKRTTILLIVFILMSFMLIRQLFQLQIIQGENYISEFQSRTTKTRVLKSTRGNIYDRNGTLVASNVLSYSLTFEDNGSYETARQKNLTLNGVAYKVLKILAANGDSLTHDFHIIVDENGNYAFDVDEGFTLDRFRADIFGYP